MKHFCCFLIGLIVFSNTMAFNNLQRPSASAIEAVKSFNGELVAISQANVYQYVRTIFKIVDEKYDCDVHLYPELQKAIKDAFVPLFKLPIAKEYFADSQGVGLLELRDAFPTKYLLIPLLEALLAAGEFEDQYWAWDALPVDRSKLLDFCDVIVHFWDSTKTPNPGKFLVDGFVRYVQKSKNGKDFFTESYDLAETVYSIANNHCMKITRITGGGEYPFIYGLANWLSRRDEKVKIEKNRYREVALYLIKIALERNPDAGFEKHYAEGIMLDALARVAQDTKNSAETRDILNELVSMVSTAAASPVRLANALRILTVS